MLLHQSLLPMKSKLALLFLFCHLAATVHSQNLLSDFGNNRVTTSSLSFSADGNYLLVGGYARTYRVSDGQLYFKTIDRDMLALDDFSYTVDLSSDGRFFIVTKLRILEIWDISSRTLIKSIRDTRLVPEAAAISPSGNDIAYMRKSGDLVFLDASTGNESLVVNVAEGGILSLAFSPDGKKVAIGTRKEGLVLFDVASRAVSKHAVSLKDIEQIRFAPSGSFIATSSSDGYIWLARFPSLEQVSRWHAHPTSLTLTKGAANPMMSLASTPISFHSSGEYLASGGADKSIKIWSIPTAELKAEWKAHSQNVTSVAFAPEGNLLASGAANYLLKGGDDTRLWTVGFISATSEASSNLTGQQPEKPVQDAAAMAAISGKADVIKPGDEYKKRLALVIGNSNYKTIPLTNPVNDARDMKIALEQYGFDVIKYEDLTQAQMKKAMDEFGESLKSYDVGLFFYAGHGIQAKGYNYLIPVDADLRSEEQVEYDCVQADRILALLEASGTRVNIIILDACRNNPFERSWTRSASGRGLAYMNAPRGTLIAYATAPGRTASDGSGRNGLYTSAILESIRIPNITILQMFQNVRSIVSRESYDQQIPWESTSLTGDFYFSIDTIRR